MVSLKASFGDKSATKGNNRSAPCGPVPDTEISAKKLLTALGQLSPVDKVLSKAELTRICKLCGITLIADKAHQCGKGQVKLSTANSWYGWGHPGMRDEKLGKVVAPIVLPSVILKKIT